MKLTDVMNRDVVQAAPEETIGEAAKKMRERAVGCLVVTVGGTVKGIISDRDLLACLHENHDPYRCRISQHMSRPVIVIGPDEDHATAAGVLCRRRIKRLPVAASGKLAGIVSLSDLARCASAEAKNLASALSFFNAVMLAQSSQWNPPAEPPAAERGVVPESPVDDDRDDWLDIGGPG